MKVPASTILGFYKTRLYTEGTATNVYGPMLAVATGQPKIYTFDLLSLHSEFAEKILAQCPESFQDVCKNWQHSDDWPEKLLRIDRKFGEMEIGFCGS